MNHGEKSLNLMSPTVCENSHKQLTTQSGIYCALLQRLLLKANIYFTKFS